MHTTEDFLHPARGREADGGLVDHTTNLVRPQSVNDWVLWHARIDDARLAVHHAAMVRFDVTWDMWTTHPTCITQKMDEAEHWMRYTLALYGIDRTTEAYWEHAWGCPVEVRRWPVEQWRIDMVAAAKVHVHSVSGQPARRRRNDGPVEDGIVNPRLVHRVISGKVEGSRLNTPERVVAAGQMAADGKTHEYIARRLQCNLADVAPMLAAYRVRYQTLELTA